MYPDSAVGVLIFRVSTCGVGHVRTPIMKKRFRRYYEKTRYVLSTALGAQEIGVGSASGALSRGVACGNIWDMI